MEEDLAGQGSGGDQDGNTDDPADQGGQGSGDGQNSGDGQTGKDVQTGAANTSGSRNAGVQKAVRTGDNGMLLFWAGLIGMSAALALIFSRKRNMR